MKKTLFLASVLAAIGSMVSGCAPIILGGAVAATGTAVSTATDRRSTGSVVNDEVLEKRIPWEISQKLGDTPSHITATAYNGKVLLTGEVPTESARAVASEVAKTSLDVGEVINELAIQENVGAMQRLSDSTLATKVRSRLIATENVYLNQMKVTVDRGIVYLMGLVTPEENKIACETAAKTSGVQRVISVCEVLSAEQIKQRMKELEVEPAAVTEGQTAQVVE
ncbi:MAG: BON domain-containing protein [Duodenibacillus sp.]|nr:BON domain-containing protein [Duodenibacillus sp.]